MQLHWWAAPPVPAYACICAAIAAPGVQSLQAWLRHSCSAPVKARHLADADTQTGGLLSSTAAGVAVAALAGEPPLTVGICLLQSKRAMTGTWSLPRVASAQ
jgi:hypothetical protein